MPVSDQRCQATQSHQTPLSNISEDFDGWQRIGFNVFCILEIRLGSTRHKTSALWLKLLRLSQSNTAFLPVCLSVCLYAHISRNAQAAADAEDINAQEKLFGMASSKYSQVARMAAKLEPYCGLWTLAARFYDKYAGWMSGPFSKLKPEEVETEVSDAYRKVYKLSKVGGCLC